MARIYTVMCEEYECWAASAHLSMAGAVAAIDRVAHAMLPDPAPDHLADQVRALEDEHGLRIWIQSVDVLD
jgi:hypothetical protein